MTFSWGAQAGAVNYVLSISDVFGNTAVLETNGTSLVKYIEILPGGGNYEWSVTAFNANGDEICTTASASFSKPQGEPTDKPTDEPEPEPEATDAPYCDPYNCTSSCVDPGWYETNCSTTPMPG